MVCTRAGVDPKRVFRLNEVYDDAEWQDLFRAACGVLNVSQTKAEHLYARTFLKDAEERFPKWFEMCTGAREFLAFQPQIHNGFASGLLDPEARKQVNDKFKLHSEDDQLVVRYRSANKLCGLYIALAHLVIQRYGDVATVSERCCMKRGDDACEIVIHWFGDELK